MKGHSLFDFLTLEIIKNELRTFVRTYYQTLITPSNQEILLKAWDDVVEYNEAEITTATDLLKQVFNISLEQQEEFIRGLNSKYGQSFVPRFENYIIKRFQEPTHAFAFDGEVYLYDLLNKSDAKTFSPS